MKAEDALPGMEYYVEGASWAGERFYGLLKVKEIKWHSEDFVTLLGYDVHNLWHIVEMPRDANIQRPGERPLSPLIIRER